MQTCTGISKIFPLLVLLPLLATLLINLQMLGQQALIGMRQLLRIKDFTYGLSVDWYQYSMDVEEQIEAVFLRQSVAETLKSFKAILRYQF